MNENFILRLLTAYEREQRSEAIQLAQIFMKSATPVQFLQLPQFRRRIQAFFERADKSSDDGDAMLQIFQMIAGTWQADFSLLRKLESNALANVLYSAIVFRQELDFAGISQMEELKTLDTGREIVTKLLLDIFTKTHSESLVQPICAIIVAENPIYALLACKALMLYCVANAGTPMMLAVVPLCMQYLNGCDVQRASMLKHEVAQFSTVVQSEELTALEARLSCFDSPTDTNQEISSSKSQPERRPSFAMFNYRSLFASENSSFGSPNSRQLQQPQLQQQMDERLKTLIKQVCHYNIKADDAGLERVSSILQELSQCLPNFEFINYYAAKSKLPAQIVAFTRQMHVLHGAEAFVDPGVAAGFEILYRLRNIPNTVESIVFNGQSLEIAVTLSAAALIRCYRSICNGNAESRFYALIEQNISLVYHWTLYSAGTVLQSLSSAQLLEALTEIIRKPEFRSSMRRRLVELASLLNRIVLYESQFSYAQLEHQARHCFSVEYGASLYGAIINYIVSNLNDYENQTVLALLLHTLTIVLVKSNDFMPWLIAQIESSAMPNIMNALLTSFFSSANCIAIWNNDILYAIVALVGAVVYCAVEKQTLPPKQQHYIKTQYLTLEITSCIVVRLLQASFPQNYQISHFLLYLTTSLKHFLLLITENKLTPREATYNVLDNVLSLLYTQFNYHLTLYNIVFCMQPIIEQYQSVRQLAQILAILMGIGYRGCIGRQQVDLPDDFKRVGEAEIDTCSYAAIVASACTTAYCTNQKQDVLVTEMAFLHFFDVSTFDHAAINCISSNFSLDYHNFAQRGSVMQIIHAQNVDRFSNICETIRANIATEYATFSAFLFLVKLFNIAYSSRVIQKDKMLSDFSDLLGQKAYLRMLASFRFSDIARVCCVHRAQVETFARQISWEQIPGTSSFAARIQQVIRHQK